jgi:hypothetical protein
LFLEGGTENLERKKEKKRGEKKKLVGYKMQKAKNVLTTKTREGP